MLFLICWSESSHLHLLRQISNCSSHIVTPFMDVLFGLIHTRTLLENLQSVLVTHSSFFPAVVPLAHCRAFLYSGKQAVLLC